jgi:hypothetical protein
LTSSSTNAINRPIINDERNQLENEETITSAQNPLNDERMQQCKSLLQNRREEKQLTFFLVE